MKRLLVFLAIALVSVSGFAKEQNITCKSGSDTRLLKISDVGEGCKLEYTKGDKMEEKANQKYGSDVCEKVMEKMKDHLEAAQFKCE